MDQTSEFESPLILRPAEAEDCEQEIPIFRNNWTTNYERVYHDLKFGSIPSIEVLAAALGRIFSSIVQENSQRELPRSSFNAKKVPGISLNDYFVRIARFSRCSFETLILAVIYIDRLHAVCPEQFINSFNAHKFAKKTVYDSVRHRCKVQRRQ